MVLASLQHTYMGAAAGATLTAFANRNSRENNVSSIRSGATWGAVFPSAVTAVHTLATKILEWVTANVRLIKETTASLASHAIAYGQANPAIAAGAGIALALLILWSCCHSGTGEGRLSS